MCVGSILDKSTYKNYEIVVVDNGDLRPDLKTWLVGKARTVTYQSQRFNLAEKMNLGARHATGEHLILLNDDIKVISPDWIEQMLQYSQLPDVGAVGAKLLFPNRRIQHAGIVLLMGNPGHRVLRPSSGGDRVLPFGGGPAELPRGDGGVHDDARGRVSGGRRVQRRFSAELQRCRLWIEAAGEGLSDRVHAVCGVVPLRIGLEGRGRGVRPGELEKFHRKWRDQYFLDPYYNPNLPADYPYYYCPD